MKTTHLTMFRLDKLYKTHHFDHLTIWFFLFCMFADVHKKLFAYQHRASGKNFQDFHFFFHILLHSSKYIPEFQFVLIENSDQIDPQIPYYDPIAIGYQWNLCKYFGALLALSSRTVSSRLVLQCRNSLQGLSVHNRNQLFWVPGHCGIIGNKETDSLAGMGSKSSFCGPEPCLPVPRSLITRVTK
jgi:hypothetical protein